MDNSSGKNDIMSPSWSLAMEDSPEPIQLESLESLGNLPDDDDLSHIFSDDDDDAGPPQPSKQSQPQILTPSSVIPQSMGTQFGAESYNGFMSAAGGFTGGYGNMMMANPFSTTTLQGIPGIGFPPASTRTTPWVSSESLNSFMPNQRPGPMISNSAPVQGMPNAGFSNASFARSSLPATPFVQHVGGHMLPTMGCTENQNKRRKLFRDVYTTEGYGHTDQQHAAPQRRKSPPTPSQSDQWTMRLEELRQYRERFGNTLVPHNWPESPPLAQWVKRQRYQYKLKRDGKHSNLSDEREADLDGLEFVWDSHAVAWEEKWNSLLEFKAKNKHCNVPITSTENPSLAVWVKCQRRQYKLMTEGKTKSTMTPERIERLNSVGFVWFPRDI